MKLFPLLILFISLCSFLSISCNRHRYNPEKITIRPRVFVAGSLPVPIVDEYDFIDVQLGTIANILTDDPDDRIYALWFNLDRRSAISIQKETLRNKGKNLHLVVAGEGLGIHPIEKMISNGVIPFVLSSQLDEINALKLYKGMKSSIKELQAELKAHKG